MRGGGRIFVVLGIILALIAGVAVFVVLANAEPQPVAVPTTHVVVAFQQVPARTEITADQVGQVEWPVRVPTPINAYAQPADVVGKLSRHPIYAGEAIIGDMVISKTDAAAKHSDAALILEKGQVAIALSVSLTSSVAEAIQAGDRVDLVVTYSANVQNGAAGATSQQYIVTNKTLENVLILQVGPWPRNVGEQSTSNGGNSGGGAVNVVTVQLNEQDAVALSNIESTASSYTFVLRAANDDQIFTTEPVTLQYLNKRFNLKIPGLGQ